MKYNMKISPVDDCVWLNEGCTLLIDGDTPEEAANAAQALNDSCRLTEESAKLRHELANLIYMAENNTGNEPSLSCFHLAIDEAKQLLLNQLKGQSNDK